MANNYMQSAFAIELHSSEEIKFLTDLVRHAEHVISEDFKLAKGVAPTAFETALLDQEAWGWDVSIDASKMRAHLSCEESANTDAVVLGLQELLRHFKLKTVITITWAWTCDKPRADEFSGGGVVFNAVSSCWTSTDDELERLSADLEPV